VFDAYWRQGPPAALRMAQAPMPVTVLLDDDEGAEPEPTSVDEDHADDDVQAVRYSRVEVLRHRDFAECSAEELDEAHRLMSRMGVAIARQRGRRHRAGARAPGGTRPAPYRATSGAHRRRDHRALRRPALPIGPRRLVLFVDVSGSMEPYARSLVRFVHSRCSGRTRVEAFALGTHLTRITRDLVPRDPDTALHRPPTRCRTGPVVPGSAT
jgi:uncharacterized protein